MGIVKDIMMHPKIWPHIKEDGMEEAMPVDHDCFHWMLIEDDNILGVFLVLPIGMSCMEMHTCILPRAWGDKANIAAKLIVDYVFSLGQKKLITRVPEFNKMALKYAMRNGMKIEGLNRASFLKGGTMVNQTCLGIVFEEWTTCQ